MHAAPFGSFTAHVPSLWQKSSVGQSGSVMQPAAHVMVAASQLPVRHWSVLAQEPSPGASPQALSFGSHEPDEQTRTPTSLVHVTTVDGADGNGVPLSSFGTHVPTAAGSALHQSCGPQSLSTWQPDTHRPLAVSHRLPV